MRRIDSIRTAKALAAIREAEARGYARAVEECARVAEDWNPGRKDRVTETGIAEAIRSLLPKTEDTTNVR